ncbi:hypothetical protein [Novipirellula sp.]|uniref:hypothetical protein n=1 Tax=Novipirellula sp. TaxID=2795430 RepID=UPI0035614B9A
MDSTAIKASTILQPCDRALITDDPKNTIATCEAIWHPYKRLSEFKENSPAEIVFDMDPCPRIDPGGLLLLLNAARRSPGTRLLISKNSSSETFDVIVDNIDNLAGALDEARREHQQKARRFLLRRITNPNEMVKQVAQWAEMVRRGTDASRGDVALWETQISEVAANTFQHARAPDGVLVAGEAFPHRGFVQLAAIDFGRTIPDCIEAEAKRRNRVLHDGDLLAFATEENVTSACVKQNQGSGLPSLVGMVKENGGSLQIMSRNGFLRVKSKRKYRKQPTKTLGSPILAGTLIVINLRVN